MYPEAVSPIPDAVSPVPTETGDIGQILDRACSIGEMPYDAHGFVGNSYGENNVNGGSVAVSPAPYETDGHNRNGYNGMSYNENSSFISNNGNGSMMSGCDDNGSTVNGYNGNENGGAQFVRRRLLPAIPKGEKAAFIF